jgi:rare lipoprotein A
MKARKHIYQLTMFKKLTASLLASATFLVASLPISGKAASGSMHTSYYAHYFHGRTTANGERFDMWSHTAAHKTLPFGTRLRVCYQGCVDVRINDRGPFISGRDLDLSYGAASSIGLLGPGVAWTTVTYL